MLNTVLWSLAIFGWVSLMRAVFVLLSTGLRRFTLWDAVGLFYAVGAGAVAGGLLAAGV